jgi:hypothetical protein
MTVTSTTSALADAVFSFGLPAELIRQRVAGIHKNVLAHSRYIRDANFTAIHIWDLEFLFMAYDDGFFAGLGQRALEGTRIQFRLAPRLTRAGGKTTRFTKLSGEVSYEIAIASMLFSVPICAPVSSRMTTGMLAGYVATLAIATPVPSTVCQCCRTQGHRKARCAVPEAPRLPVRSERT